ncbi:MAG: hypothetical protein Q9213_007856 [Squamulea squamosa]
MDVLGTTTVRDDIETGTWTFRRPSQIVHWQLVAVRNSCKVTHTEAPESKPTQRTEDAIRLGTLDELSRNTNKEIRNAAIKIIVDRAAKSLGAFRSSSRHMLLRDLGSRDQERRARALTSIKYLYQAVPQCFDTHKKAVVQELIVCLINLLPFSCRFETARMEGKEIHRTETERDALELMYLLMLRFGAQVALECNISGLWLEKYPFGGDLENKYLGDEDPQLAIRFRYISQLMSGQHHDPAMFRILSLVWSDEETQKSILKSRSSSDSKLCSINYDCDPMDDPNVEEQRFADIWYEVHGTANAPDPGLGPMMRRGNRVRDESIEEQALRRRRREAMVLGETGRPVERENIIQRVST